jgi:enoyl-CoA hydratase/carnithine racemase
MVSVEQNDRIAVLKLDRSITNALNLQHVTELAEAVERVKRNSEVRGMVLTSANEKIFSLGFDIPWLYEAGPEEVGRFFRFFNKTCLTLYTLPKPTLAAINGHAVAGGCILALCCDYRYIAEGRKLMGLNEIKLGVPVPYLPDCILRQLVGVRNARDMMETGEFYPSERLLQLGMVDEVLPPETLLSRAIAKAAELGSMPQAYALIKQNRVETIEAQVLQHGEEKTDAFLRAWSAEDTRERLKEAIKKF